MTRQSAAWQPAALREFLHRQQHGFQEVDALLRRHPLRLENRGHDLHHQGGLAVRDHRVLQEVVHHRLDSRVIRLLRDLVHHVLIDEILERHLHDADIDRIIKMRISPINISVHTTNPELRIKMMKNKRAGEVLKYLDRFCDADINMRGQIVLCRGINDGDELLRSMRDLSRYYPVMDSVSIVPAGLTKFRDGLYPLTQYSKDEARKVIEQIDAVANELYEKNGSRMFFAADEFYIKAGLDIPDADYYEGYPQIENGVGMVRSLMDDFDFTIDDFSGFVLKKKREISMATGVAAYPYISDIAKKLMAVFPNLEIHVYEIVNDYFGHEITVSGLLTGKDIVNQLNGKSLGETLIIPSNALREGEDVFLCGMTLCELEKNLGVKVTVTGEGADSLISTALGKNIRRHKDV